MKRCSKCAAEFATKGLDCYCAKCRLDYGRAWRAANPGRERHLERERYWSDPDLFRSVGRAKAKKYGVKRRPIDEQRAHWRIHELTRSGRMVKPKTCRRCGEGKLRIEAHHPDYTKRELVEWLCSRCHGATRRIL